MKPQLFRNIILVVKWEYTLVTSLETDKSCRLTSLVLLSLEYKEGGISTKMEQEISANFESKLFDICKYEDSELADMSFFLDVSYIFKSFQHQNWKVSKNFKILKDFQEFIRRLNLSGNQGNWDQTLHGSKTEANFAKNEQIQMFT